jgi:hypothetical protein
MAISAALDQWIKHLAINNLPLTGNDPAVKARYDMYKKTAGPKQDISVVSGGKTASAASTSADSGKAKREAQYAAFTGWDNDPQVRALQEKSWTIYISTGKWDTAEQQQLHKSAEEARKYNNPTYGGSDYGPIDWMGAEKITPRTTTPGANALETTADNILDPSKFGSYIKMFFGGVFILVIVSFFRRG